MSFAYGFPLQDCRAQVPAELQGCIGWWSAALSTPTVVDATFSDTGDFSQASWTKTGVDAPASGQADPDGGSAAWLLTENTASTTHSVSQAPASAQTSVVTVRAKVKAGTRTWVRIATGAEEVWFNLGTPAVGTTTGGVLNARIFSIGSSFYQVEATLSWSSPDVVHVGPSTGDGVSTYTGASGTLVLYQVTIEQKKLSAFSDLSASGYHATQATSASKGILLPRYVLGYPAIYLDGVDDYWDVSGVASHYDGDDTSGSWWCVRKLLATTANRHLLAMRGGVTSLLEPLRDISGKYGIFKEDDVAATDSAVTTSLTTDLGLHSVVVVMNGKTPSIYVDGVSQTVTAGDLDVAELSLTTASIGRRATIAPYFFGYFSEIACFDRVLSADDVAALSAYSLANYGVA